MKDLTHTEIWEDILKKMRSMLTEKGMTQIKLAEILGVDRGTVTRWLKGDRKASKSNPEIIIGYMRALGLDPSEYFGGAQNNEDLVSVKKARTVLGAGSSLIIENGHDEGHVFRKDFIHSLGHQSANNLVMFNVVGQSMEPLVLDGDTVLVDKTQGLSPKDGEIWAVWIGEDVLIKRILLHPSGGYILSSENKSFRDIEATGEQEAFGFIGKVRWLGRML